VTRGLTSVSPRSMIEHSNSVKHSYAPFVVIVACRVAVYKND